MSWPPPPAPPAPIVSPAPIPTTTTQGYMVEYWLEGSPIRHAITVPTQRECVLVQQTLRVLEQDDPDITISSCTLRTIHE